MSTTSKLRILFVHEVSYQTKVVFEMHEFPEFLARRGHDVVFVDFPEHKVGWKSVLNRPQKVRGRALTDTTIRLYSLANIFPGIIGRLCAFLIGWIQMYKIMSKEKPDVVVLYGVPTNGLQTLYAAKKFGIPVVHRSIDVSHLLRQGPFSKPIQWFEKRVFERSDLIIANNTALAKYIHSKSSAQREVRVLSPGILDLVDDVDQALKDPEFDFVFMGTIFRFSGLDWFLTEMSKEHESDHSSLLIIGDGEDGQRLRDLSERLGLQQRVKFTGFIEFSKLKQEVRRARIGLLPFLEIPVARYALPGKVLQYARFGIPTVSTRLDGLMSYLPNGQGVLYASPGSDFMDVAKSLLKNKEESQNTVARGLETLEEKANWDGVIEKLENSIFEIINRSI